MKKLALAIGLTIFGSTGFSQGLVIFNNNPQTLVSLQNFQQVTTISGPAGTYYFGLLTSLSGASGSFTFANLYATNSAAAPGRFIGGIVAVPGWAAGTSISYEVAGWSSELGTTFNPAWLTFQPPGFGLSTVGSGVAGGTTADGQSFPTLPLFGGTGIGQGFLIQNVPEPSKLALLGLGAVVLVFGVRRKTGTES